MSIFHRNGGLKRPYAAGVALCLLLALLACCSKPEPTAEPVSIAFAHAESETEFFEILSQQFHESHPTISVKLGLSVSEADCYMDLPYNFVERRDRGKILSVDPIMERDSSFDPNDFYPGASRLFDSQGKTWGVPAGVNVLVMYYNQELFDRYGVVYPQPGWTWADFLDAGLALSDPEAQVFGYVVPQGGDAIDPLLFIYQHGGKIFDDMQNPTYTTFDDPLTIEALEWYAELSSLHNVVPTPAQIREFYGSNPNALYRGILQGKFGMWVGWFSERGGLIWPVEWPMRWGMVPLPSDAFSFTGGLVAGYFISADTEQPEACWELISFFSQQTPPALFPARRSLAESAAYETQVGKEIAAVGRESLENALLVSPEMLENGQALEIFSQALNEIVSGRATPAQAMDRAQRQAEQ